MKRKKEIISVLVSLIFAIAIAIFFPSNIGKQSLISNISLTEEKSYVAQHIEYVSLEPVDVTKVYHLGKLIGILYDGEIIDRAIDMEEAKLAGTKFEGYEIDISDEVYILKEKSFWRYENKDDEILSYIMNNNLLVVQAVKIEIVKEEELVDTIFVRSVEEFSNALKRFALCFIDEKAYIALENHEKILDLTTYGSQDKNIYIEETIKATVTGASIGELFADEEEIFMYLCYGRDYELEYYTVVDYDTISGVASKAGLLPKQLLAINDELDNINQAIVPGQKLVITYFTSPLTVVVEQQRLVQEVTYPTASTYTFDPTVTRGEVVEDVAPATGYNDATYTDIYVNGILTSYRQDSIVIRVEPTIGQYRYNQQDYTDRGVFFSLPVRNPVIYCDFYCYANHHGCDFIDRYNRYGPVLAAADGIIIQKGYNSSMGYYYYINHSNGIVARYLHMKTPGYFNVGDTVLRGEIIGQIGSTGRSTGPHLDIGFYIDGVLVDPCRVLPCEQAGRW
ncbi:MAG: peptidoglycan DD-metalloendopeptidase family protein [Erysipelotrichaceae bacterium]|jgi:murein DD-endopeptidase MepM/ murein hydrolase activator NlpD